MRVGIDLVPWTRFQRLEAHYGRHGLIHFLGSWNVFADLPFSRQAAIVWGFKEAYAKSTGRGIHELPPPPHSPLDVTGDGRIQSQEPTVYDAIWVPDECNVLCLVWCHSSVESGNSTVLHPPRQAAQPVHLSGTVSSSTVCISDPQSPIHSLVAYTCLDETRSKAYQLARRSETGHAEGRWLAAKLIRQLVPSPIADGEISIVRSVSGAPVLHLPLRVWQQLVAANIHHISLSISHTENHAAAAVTWVNADRE